MTQLNQGAVKITQQNVLNAESASGAYPLPGSRALVRLDSQIGALHMSLVSIAPNADGTRLTLRIQGESNTPLPAFSATAEHGQIQGTMNNYQEVNVHNQLTNTSANILAPSDIGIPLQINGLTPDQLGLVRIHGVQPVSQ